MVHECNKIFLTKSQRLCYTDKYVKAIVKLALDAQSKNENIKQVTVFKFTSFMLNREREMTHWTPYLWPSTRIVDLTYGCNCSR
jgi:hypothetical protein